MEEALGASRPRPRTCCSPKQEHTREQPSAIIEVNGSGRGDSWSRYIVGPFSPGCWLQTFSPGWTHPPGQKGSGTFSPGCWLQTFSPGWSHQLGLESPPAKACGASRWAREFSPGWWLQPGLVLLLVPGPISGRLKPNPKVCSLLVFHGRIGRRISAMKTSQTLGHNGSWSSKTKRMTGGGTPSHWTDAEWNRASICY